MLGIAGAFEVGRTRILTQRGEKSLMLGGCITCMVMSGNGVAIGATSNIMRERRLLIRRILRRPTFVFFEADRGLIPLTLVVRRVVLEGTVIMFILAGAALEFTAVFALWFCRERSLSNREERHELGVSTDPQELYRCSVWVQ